MCTAQPHCRIVCKEQFSYAHSTTRLRTLPLQNLSQELAYYKVDCLMMNQIGRFTFLIVFARTKLPTTLRKGGQSQFEPQPSTPGVLRLTTIFTRGFYSVSFLVYECFMSENIYFTYLTSSTACGIVCILVG